MMYTMSQATNKIQLHSISSRKNYKSSHILCRRRQIQSKCTHKCAIAVNIPYLLKKTNVLFLMRPMGAVRLMHIPSGIDLRRNVRPHIIFSQTIYINVHTYRRREILNVHTSVFLFMNCHSNR